jgi:hypothetical protein
LDDEKRVQDHIVPGIPLDGLPKTSVGKMDKKITRKEFGEQ